MHNALCVDTILCHWTQHVNDPYYFDLYDKMETRTSRDLCEKKLISM